MSSRSPLIPPTRTDLIPTPARILILDDDEHTIEILSTFLVHHGYAIEGVGDAVRAMDSITSDPPALLILDLHLPGVSGMDLLKKLKVDGFARELPVVCFTAMADTATREEARGLGCSAFITKPALPQEMLAEVEKVLALLRS